MGVKRPSERISSSEIKSLAVISILIVRRSIENINKLRWCTAETKTAFRRLVEARHISENLGLLLLSNLLMVNFFRHSTGQGIQ